MISARQFEIPNAVRVVAGFGNLPCLQINSAIAQAQIYLHGAHVAHWQPAGQQPVLFMSAKSHFDVAKPIRGGVPLCFPWFGPKAGDSRAPAHGFARQMEWQIESTRQLASGEVEVALMLETIDATQALWPADAVMRNRIVIGAALEMTLEVLNRGSTPIIFEEAQHTYLSVGDVRQVHVDGLNGITYIDKVDAAKRKVQIGSITITQETDRVYLGTQTPCVLHDPSLSRSIKIEKKNSNATVVWNPWIAKAKAMHDFGDDEWPGMICIETCNAADYAITLGAGQTHQMTTRISVAGSAY